MTIRNRITLWFTLLVALLMLSSGTISWLAMRENLYQHLNREIREKALKAQEIMNAMVFEHQKHQHDSIPFQAEIPEILTKIITEEGATTYHGSMIQLANPEGQIFARTPNLGQKHLPILSPGSLVDELSLSLEPGNRTRVIYYCDRITALGKTVATVQIALPLTETDLMLRQLMWYRLMELLMVVVIAVLLGQFLSRRALAPMVRITREVRGMEGQNLSKRLDLSSLSPDEIRHLAQTFNGLLDRISAAFAQQEQFIADASHELRSPLTVIRGTAQLMHKRGQQHPEFFNECLDNVIQETHRLERLVTDLLLLARSREQGRPMEAVDLCSLIQQTVQELQALHPQIRTELPELPIWLQGDSDSLKRVLINLIDNALRAIEAGGTVKVTARRLGQGVEVSVSDDGHGIDPRHLPHLFDRFYRVDTARSRAQGGSGLGLSISRQLLEAQGGSIHAQSTPGEGSCFSFWLPCLEETADSESRAASF